MRNKKIYIATGIAAVIIAAFLISKPDSNIPIEKETGKTEENQSPSSAIPAKTVKNSATQTGVKATNTGYKVPADLPDLDFIDKRTAFYLKDFPDVKITIEKAVFGRGEAIKSTGCAGNINQIFSAYFYPEGGVCITDSKIDGSPQGIVAIHMLIENKSNYGFGGNSDTLRLSYLGTDSKGKVAFKFAYPLLGLNKYYINGYSSKQIVLSYLVPQDQLVFNLVSGYKEPALENKTINVFDFSTSGLLIDFREKIIKAIR